MATAPGLLISSLQNRHPGNFRGKNAFQGGIRTNTHTLASRAHQPILVLLAEHDYFII